MQMHYLGYCPIHNEDNDAYLISPLTLETIKGKNVIIFGAGFFGKCARRKLMDLGVSIKFFCSNDLLEINKTKYGIDVISPAKAVKIDNSHFVIAIGNNSLLRRFQQQLLLAGIYDFSCFYINNIGMINNLNVANAARRTINRIAIEKVITGVYCDVPTAADFIDTFNALFNSCRWSDMALDKYVTDFSTLHKPKKLLDIGPGNGLQTGILCELFPDLQVSWCKLKDKKGGVDIVESHIDLQNISIPLTTYYGVFQDPCFKIDEKFDIIIFSHVLEHFRCNPVPDVKKIGYMLQDNGYVIFAVPKELLISYESYKDLPEYDAASKVEEWLRMSTHTYSYSKQELEEIFANAGLGLAYYYMHEHTAKYGHQYAVWRKL